MNYRRGFTIVELLIVIVVIGILAAIVLVSYSGLQKRGTEAVMESGLKQAAAAMKVVRLTDGAYPSTLPSNIKPPAGMTFTVSPSGQAVYSGLSSEQNGLLFHDICADLISRGVGSKPDDGHDYISACTVYNKSQIHIDGWNGRDVSVPLTTTSLQDYVNSYIGGDAELFYENAQNFMDQLASEFQAGGGQFPVNSFWDNWATPTNGGVMKPTLPPPTYAPGDPNSFCINATSDSYGDIKRHITETHALESGECS